MRGDFYNTHLVPTRYRDHYCDSASRNLQQGNERSRVLFDLVLAGL